MQMRDILSSNCTPKMDNLRIKDAIDLIEDISALHKSLQIIKPIDRNSAVWPYIPFKSFEVQDFYEKLQDELHLLRQSICRYVVWEYGSKYKDMILMREIELSFVFDDTPNWDDLITKYNTLLSHKLMAQNLSKVLKMQTSPSSN